MRHAQPAEAVDAWLLLLKEVMVVPLERLLVVPLGLLLVVPLGRLLVLVPWVLQGGEAGGGVLAWP